MLYGSKSLLLLDSQFLGIVEPGVVSMGNMARSRLLCCVALALCGCGRINNDSPIGELLLIEPDYIQATLHDGESKLRHFTISLKNRHSIPVHIASIEASCGCTVADNWPQAPIMPGASESLTVSVTLPDVGRKVSTLKLLLVGHNEPAAITFELNGKAKELPSTVSYMRRIPLRARSYSKPIVREIPLRTLERSDHPPWLQAAHSDKDWLNAELSAPISGDSDQPGVINRTYSLKLSATLSSSGQQLTQYGKIKIDTRPGTGELSPIEVEASISPAVCVIPARIVASKDDSRIKVRVILLVEDDSVAVDDVVIAERDGIVVDDISTLEDKRSRRILYNIDIGSLQKEQYRGRNELVVLRSKSREVLTTIPIEILK